MKINYTPQVHKTMKSYGKKTEKANNVKKSSFSKDKIDISSSAKDVQLATATLKSLPDVRAEKIAALKEAIDSGTYNVPSIDIAEKMIEW